MREMSGRHQPSRPMMIVGEAIGATLARLERQLDASPAVPAGGPARMVAR
jgi:hypothetical protein